MSKPALRTIKCAGSPRQVGFAHGSQAKKEVSLSIAAYHDIFHAFAGISWPRVTELAILYEKNIRQNWPALMEELEGLAEGAGVDLLDIVTLNCRSEIALTQPLDGCTALSWNQGHEQWLAQNWDWLPSIKKSLILLEIAPNQNRPHMKFMTEAGIIGKIGMNANGLATTLNAIRANITNQSLLPIHLFLRLLLEQSSVKSALSFISSIKGIASACHILLADGTQAVGIESAPIGFSIVKANTSGFVHHTNHLVDAKLAKATDAVNMWADSDSRLEQIRALSAPGVAASWASHKALRDMLSDRTLGSRGICRYDGDVNPASGSDTLFCITMNCTKKQYQIKMGRPDEDGEITEVSF